MKRAMPTTPPYKGVRHIMIPLRSVTAEQRAFIEDTAVLAEAFGKEAYGEDYEDYALLISFVVQTAAEQVWARRQDAAAPPSWSDLDPELYLKTIEQGLSNADCMPVVSAVLVALVSYLNALKDRKGT